MIRLTEHSQVHVSQNVSEPHISKQVKHMINIYYIFSSRRASPVPLMNDFEVFGDLEKNEDEHPLQLLARAARIMNPKQFELEKHLECHVPLPGRCISMNS